jgi:hypothetical protein
VGPGLGACHLGDRRRDEHEADPMGRSRLLGVRERPGQPEEEQSAERLLHADPHSIDLVVDFVVGV